jgi:hypothetical protein
LPEFFINNEGDFVWMSENRLSQFQTRSFELDTMRDTMPVLFELLEEPEPSVRAVLDHFIFVFIHPYMDGTGRIGKFLMNAMLALKPYHFCSLPCFSIPHYL